MGNQIYPTEDELKKIEEWAHTDGYGNLFEYIRPLWEGYGRMTKKENTYDLATGGWSGNEEIIGALKRNRLFWCVCWELSERGGHFIFNIPPSGKEAV